MTDEQSKQNAEEDSNAYTTYWGNRIKRLQSRLIKKGQEIKELKEKLLFADESIKDADKWIAYYKLEIYKLRNPWISVDDRLPEKAIGKSERSEYVLCRHKNGSYYVAYWHVGLEYWYSMPYKIDKSNITHWMPIPELQKGGQKNE